MFNLDEFSDTILELTILAQEEPVDRYQQKALSAVQRVLPFDMAWWGMMSADDTSFQLHSSHLFNLPSAYVAVWEQTKSDDNVARAACEQPQRTAYFDEQTLAAAPGLATLTSSHGIGQAFCTASQAPCSNALTFLSLYRTQHEPRFSADERMLKQYLMPHLCSAWSANRSFQIEQFKASASAGSAAIAVVDRQCAIVSAEASFRDFVNEEWPDWSSASLPLPLLRFLRSAEEAIRLERIVIRRCSFGDLSLLVARKRTRADLLTKRERSIAEAFSRGLSYKEIARELDSAPATVRHHLRMIYEKLGVSNKATMMSALREQSAGFQREELISRQRKLASARSGRVASPRAGTRFAEVPTSFS